MRRAKILATLGPSSNSAEVLESMIRAGVSAVRINMSHGTQDQHAEVIRLAREAAAKLKSPLSILVDLSGPKIRTRMLQGGRPVQLKEGQEFTITTEDIIGDS